MNIVFFDLDHTLLKGNSANLFIKYQLKKGELGWGDLIRGLYYTLRYRMNAIDIHEVTSTFVRKYEGVTEESVIAQCEDWFEKMVRAEVYLDAKSLIESHRQQGHQMYLLTASTIYACMPISRSLGLHGYVGSRLSMLGGKFTGEIEKPLCYGDGKVTRAAEFLRNMGSSATLADTTFYTDSITDLPMLLAVGDPQVVNPDYQLAREAKRRGWPVRYFVK